MTYLPLSWVAIVCGLFSWWHVAEGRVAWQPYTQMGPSAPCASFDGTFAVLPHSNSTRTLTGVVVGGKGETGYIGGNTVDTYTATIDTTAKTIAWTAVPSLDAPSARYNQGTLLMPRLGQFHIWGGVRNTTVLNDIARFDIWENTWTTGYTVYIEGRVTPQLQLYGHSITEISVYNSETRTFLVFGGRVSTESDNDDAYTDQLLRVSVNPQDNLINIWVLSHAGGPSPRLWHSAAYDHDQGIFYVTGGCLYGGKCSSGSYALVVNEDNQDPATWNRLAELPLFALSGHESIFAPCNQLLLFGGEDSKGTGMNQILLYQPDSDTWSTIKPDPDLRDDTFWPKPRLGLRSSLVHRTSEWFFYGGLSGWNGNKVYYNDVFSLNLQEFCQGSSNNIFVTGVVIGVAVMVVLGAGILGLWYCKRRRKAREFQELPPWLEEADPALARGHSTNSVLAFSNQNDADHAYTAIENDTG